MCSTEPLQGRLLCEWASKMSPALPRRIPGSVTTGPSENAPAGFGGEMQPGGPTRETARPINGHIFGSPILPPTSFKDAVATMPKWLSKVNGGGSSPNCVLTAAATAWYFLGNPLYRAPAACEALTLQEAESLVGGSFTGQKDDIGMYKYIDALPNGSVGMVTSQVPGIEVGHAFTFVKANGEVIFPDGQPGGHVLAKSGSGTPVYRVNVMGNGLQPR